MSRQRRGSLAALARLCAYYRVDQRAAAGWTLILISVRLATLWIIAAFIGWPPREKKSHFAQRGAYRVSSSRDHG